MVSGTIFTDDQFNWKIGFLDEKAFQGVFNIGFVVVSDAADADLGFGWIAIPALHDFFFGS